MKWREKRVNTFTPLMNSFYLCPLETIQPPISASLKAFLKACNHFSLFIAGLFDVTQQNDVHLDSNHSSVTSFHYYPYAAVDPAFKNFRSNLQNRGSLITKKRIIYPEGYEEETTFSDSFSCVSDGFKLNEGKAKPGCMNELKSLVNSIKTMPKELR